MTIRLYDMLKMKNGSKYPRALAVSPWHWTIRIRMLAITTLFGATSVFGQAVVGGSDIDVVANLVVGQRLYARVNIAESAFAERNILRLANETELARVGAEVNEFVKSLSIESSSAKRGNYYLISKEIVREPEVEFVIIEETTSASVGHLFRLRANGESTEIKEISEIDLTESSEANVVKGPDRSAEQQYSEYRSEPTSQVVESANLNLPIEFSTILGRVTERLEDQIKGVERAVQNQSDSNLTELIKLSNQGLFERVQEPSINDYIAKETVTQIVRNSFQSTDKSEISLFQAIKLNGYEIILLLILAILIIITIKLSKVLKLSQIDSTQAGNHAIREINLPIYQSKEIARKAHKKDRENESYYSGNEKYKSEIKLDKDARRNSQDFTNKKEAKIRKNSELNSNRPLPRALDNNRTLEKAKIKEPIQKDNAQKSPIQSPNHNQEKKISEGSENILIALNFVNMGEKEVAKEMLKDILKSGSKEEKIQAQEILNGYFSNEN